MNLFRGVGWVALLTVPLACGDGPGGAAVQGELGDGFFRYVCVGSSDSYCPDGMTASSFPEAIAVGGRFSLRYEPKGGGALPVVEPGSRTAISKSGDVFTLHEPGFVAVLAQDAFGDVIDLLHLRSRRVANIAVLRDAMEHSMVRLEPGERVDLAAQPRDELHTPLAGSLAYAWTSSDPEVFVVTSDSSDDDITIEAVTPGQALLAVEAGGYELTVAVHVTPGGDPTTDSDGESGDGTDTGTDASTEDSTGGTAEGTTDGGTTEGG
jgi:hypothetical protein